MSKQQTIQVYRVFFAVLTLVAMVIQALHLADVSSFHAGNFFSYFTIQNNILAAVVFLYLAVRTRPPTPTVDSVRGATTLYLTLTGIVYGVLLTGYQQEVQTSLDWVDTVLHRIIPLVVFADWLIAPPRDRIEFRKALWWLAYPALYLVYTLIRGPIVDWYPYPFLDPDHPDYAQGYWRVALFAVGIAIGVVIFTAIILWLGNRQRDSSAPVPTV